MFLQGSFHFLINPHVSVELQHQITKHPGLDVRNIFLLFLHFSKFIFSGNLAVQRFAQTSGKIIIH